MEPRALVVAHEEAEAPVQPVIDGVVLDALQEVLGHDDGRAEHRKASGEREDLVRQRMRLEQHVALPELEAEPVAVPRALPRDVRGLVGGDRAEVLVGDEEGQHAL